jgi:excisionase family DNA binding protein
MSDFTLRAHHTPHADETSSDRRAVAAEPDCNAPLMTPEEAAAYLKISPRKLASLTKGEVVKSVRIPPRSRRYRKEDLDRSIEGWSN